MRIQISLPIDTNGYSIEKQKKIAQAWQTILEADGHEVTNPFVLAEHLENVHRVSGKRKPTYIEYLAEDLCNLDFQEAIFFCQGWTESYGCMVESKRAVESCLIPMFDYKYKLG
jgi:hypothetical protein